MFTRLYISRLSRLFAVLVALAILEGGIAHKPATAARLTGAPTLDSADLRPAFHVDSVGPASEYTVAFHLTGVNHGPDAASQVALLYEALAGGIVTSVDPADWSCTKENYIVTCQRPDLPVGSSPEVVVRVRLPALFGNTITNRFSISSATIDPDESNNTLGLFLGFAGKDNFFYALLPMVLNQ